MKCRHLLIALVTGLAALAVAPAAQAQTQAPERPDRRALYHNGPDTRYLLDGEWLFRLDPSDVGLAQRFFDGASPTGWAPTTVPNAGNATDQSTASMTGTVGWYRKDFRLPSSAKRFDWVVLFESVNYRTRAWLNGKEIGSNTGAYLPFELRLRDGDLRRGGTNRLVVRIDNRRLPSDFPPSGELEDGTPAGGWWNYGGILREVYLRRVDHVDVSSVRVRPRLRSNGDADVEMRVVVRNHDSSGRDVAVRGFFAGRSLTLGSARIGARSLRSFTRTVRVRNPRLWSPANPNLYNATFRVSTLGAERVRWRMRTGLREIKVDRGRLLLNGKPMNFRGVGLHEDHPQKGFAIDNADRRTLVRNVEDLGATLMRAHYPLHPYLHELADRKGVMVWSEIPVYHIKAEYLRQANVRRLAARELEDNIRENINHPSIVVWSVGNELSSRPGPEQAAYLREAAASAKRMDPTRPVGYAFAAYPSAGCQEAYRPLDIIGINDYFGWYPGPNGQIADRELLSQYLDQARACYPDKALAITEFGAEANRSGPVEERGTFEFQQDFIKYHLGVFATKPWLSGATYWAMQEFRVRPNWEGGNPRPNPPIHEKGVVRFDGTRKPAWSDLQRSFSATQQFGVPR